MVAWTKAAAAQKVAYARYFITLWKRYRKKTIALGESITKETSNSIKPQSNQIDVMTEDSAIETEIVLLKDALEIYRTKFEEISIKYPIGFEDATIKAKVDEVKKH